MQLLSLVLLVAQFGMVAHATTHLKADPHGAPAAAYCGECLSFAPLQNIVGAAPVVVQVVKAPFERAAEVRVVQDVPAQAFCAFRSRAPPVSI